MEVNTLIARKKKTEKALKEGNIKIYNRILRDKYLYLLLLPGIIYFIMFRYAPMGGLVIAFKDYSIFKGIWKSPWNGFNNFLDIFNSADFWKILRNTLVISLGKIIIGFPVPIILALLLNEMKNLKIKKITQTVLYFPYFVSWTVIGTVIISLFSPTFGVLGSLYKRIWGESANLMINSRHFVPLLIISDIWKNAGWGTIIYLAALTQVEVSLYESSIVDGANRWQQMWYITLPSIKSVIVLTLILRVGWIMHAGFEQIIIFTMLFHGGIIPTYLVIRSYRMVNTFWALILPDAIAVYNLLVLIRFFKNIPASLIEAAYIDGYNDIGIFFRIVLPLSKAGLAVISLFYAVSLWNSFLPGLIYLNDPSLWPIQVVLFSLVTGTTVVDENITSQITNEQAIKMATAFVAVLPILLSYPFAQKYFVKGVMLGSVKA